MIPSSPAPLGSHSSATLHIDLAAIVDNWRLLRDRAANAECAAVVKADAYGLGAAHVAPALAAAGCRVFFVATLDEGIALRWCLQTGSDEHPAAGAPPPNPPTIFVLNGAPSGAEMDLVQHGLIPVLNSLADIDAWGMLADLLAARLPAALHIDTGMSRLGLPANELATLIDAPQRLDGLALTLIMSHLACADEPDHELNIRQRLAFAADHIRLPAAPASLANSAGIFLGPDYCFNLVRPGAALYGIAPTGNAPNPMRSVARLDGRVLQVRQIDRGTTVGYGASHRVAGSARIATVGVGYADGFFRSLGNRGAGYVGTQRVPLVGRVSMDLITFDVTDVPESLVQPGSTIELIGPNQSVDAIAAEAGTIGYEILTALGMRYARLYQPAGI